MSREADGLDIVSVALIALVGYLVWELAESRRTPPPGDAEQQDETDPATTNEHILDPGYSIDGLRLGQEFRHLSDVQYINLQVVLRQHNRTYSAYPDDNGTWRVVVGYKRGESGEVVW